MSNAGDERMLESALIGEIRGQAAGMGIAVSRLNESLARLGGDSSVDEVFWHDIHAALSCAAMISKVLWGDSGRKVSTDVAARRSRVRRRLGVEEDSIVHSRTVRNSFEHFDERLETWWKTDERHNLADRIVGPRDRTIAGLGEQSFMHWFDQETKVVYLVMDGVNLEDLFKAVHGIGERAAALLGTPWWDWPAEPDEVGA